MRHDLLTLRLFIAVYEELSIAKAAEREHIAASALSKRLSDLETMFQVELFRRNRAGLEPTSAAHTLVHHARLLMRDLTQMESELADHEEGIKGQVRIHSSVWAIIQYLPEDLAAFTADHPLVRIDLEENISSAIVQAVTENAADIGILVSSVPAPGLHAIPYRADDLVAVMPPDHPLAGRDRVCLADMAPYDLIGPKPGSALDGLVTRAASSLDRPLKVRIRASGFEIISRMAEAKLGIGLVPQGCARRYVASAAVVAVPLDEPWARRQLNLCVTSLESLSQAARLLVDHLAAG
jgi:DNA-binding transcriptional LysR family regulator